MKYRKDVKNKPFLGSGGPRDQQRRQQLQDVGSIDENVIQDLKQQIVKLRKELTTPKDSYTGEQVDKEIRKAVRAALQETGKADPKYIKQLETEIKKLKETKENTDTLKIQIAEFETKNQTLAETILKLKAKVEALTDILSNKDKIQNKQINQLTSVLDLQEEAELDLDRPKMKEVFIDPVGKGKKLEPHIDIKDVPFDGKVKMSDKVDKLKSLLGGLPEQKSLVKK